MLLLSFVFDFIIINAAEKKKKSVKRVSLRWGNIPPPPKTKKKTKEEEEEEEHQNMETIILRTIL